MSESDADALKQATLSGVRWMSLARVAGEVIAFASMIALARLISPREFGEFAVALVVVEIALTITGEGFGTALMQRREVTREHLQAGLFMSISTGLVLGAVAFLTAPLIFTPLFGASTSELVRISSPMFLIAAITAVPLAVAQRRLDFRLIGVAQILSLVVRVSASLALALAGLEATALMLGWIAGSAAMMMVLLAYARLPWPRPRLAAAREIAGFGVPAALSGLCWTGFRNADFAIVGARLGTVNAGLYWRGYQLGIEYQRKVGSVVNQIVLPVYARASDLEAMLALRQRVVRVVCAVLIPALAALVVLAPTLVPWLFGSAWKEAVLPTQMLAISGIVTVPGDTVGAVVLAVGRARAWLVYHLGLFVIYAAAIYIAAGFGLTAVCVAVIAVQALSTVAAYVGLMRGLIEHPLRRLCWDVAPGTAAALAVVAGVGPTLWGLSQFDLPPLVTMTAASGVGAVAGAVVLRLVSRPAWNDVSGLARRMMGGRGIRLRRPAGVAAGVESG